MTGDADAGTRGVSSTRRRLLAAVGVAASGTVAGCGGFGSGGGTATAADDTVATATTARTATATDSPTPTRTATEEPTPTPTATATEADAFGPDAPTYGFEDGLGPFEDSSQANAAPSVTEAWGFRGDYGLALASDPGSENRCSVTSTAAFADTRSHAVWMARYESAGPQSSVGIRLRHVDSEAELAVAVSDYFDGVVVGERDAFGEEATRETITSVSEGWTKMDVSIRNDGEVVGRYDDVARSIDTVGDWTERSVRFELIANAWERGDAVGAAFDAVELSFQ